MIINKNYYKSLLDKFDDVPILHHDLKSKSTKVSLKMLLYCHRKTMSIHLNFQGLKTELIDLAKSLFIEFSNDIYLNHYDLPAIKDGDLVKRRSDGEYYKVIKTEGITFRLSHIPRKTKKDSFPANIPEIRYDKLALKYLKVSAGVSEKTIKNYFDFFEKLNNEKSEFPRTHFEKKSVFIAKKTLWDELPEKSKIPSIYLPNPREENGISEIKSIPALSDCLTYFTPKYEVCLGIIQKVATVFYPKWPLSFQLKWPVHTIKSVHLTDL